MLVEGELGVAVQMPAPTDHGGLQQREFVFDAIDHLFRRSLKDASNRMTPKILRS